MTASTTQKGERIAKYLARAGVASRRQAEALIAARRISLNGRVVKTPATFVQSGDAVTCDGTPIGPPAAPKLWLYHKPDGLICTHHDPQGRPTIFEQLPARLGRVISVGRLDLTSEGLMLLTNHGGLARHLELPKTAWKRRYRVRAHGRVNDKVLDRLRQGVSLDGVLCAPLQVNLDRQQGANAWLNMVIAEGKNREIRRLCEAADLHVNRLIRVAFGPFQLGHLPPGEVKPVAASVLRDQLGPFWAHISEPQASGS